ncbi:hypothetical protein DL769_003040 [Monosporascus sp. CRB-8-3]|nr:hypothetical protein DL769_003040 [Monosporascus sp. CRB-8-3]
MSGSEVIGLIASIITIVGATVKVYCATDASGLPEAFCEVAKRLPLVQETLQTAREYLNTAPPNEAFCNAIKPVLEGCEDKAKRLAVIFEKVVPQADASGMERYLLAARTLGKGDTVESLMNGILDDVQLLTANRVTKLPTEAAIAHLIQAAIDEVSAIPPSLPAGLDSSINHDAERNALLKELKWTDPTLDKLRIERTKGGLYEAASSWILAHPSYHQWRHDETKLLWIKGGAGKGKTMLLVAITRELRPCTKLDKPGADSFLSFFFCQNTDDRLNNAVAILKGLIYLLLVQDGSLVSYLKDYYDRMGKKVFDVTSNVNAFDVLSNVFRQIIQHPRSETVYLAVDALDECEEGLPDLLSLIRESALQENRIKWIVTSRNRVEIDKRLALDNPEAKLSLEVNSEAVSRAIEVYVDHKVSQVPSLTSNPGRQAAVRQKLLDKADGTFLWVDLILRTIGGDDSVDGVGALGDDIVRLIDEIPPGLPPLYDRMMRNIGMSTSAYQGPCLVVLSIATLAYRPLHLLELRMLAGLEQYDTADLERIVDMCGSFLTLLESRIYPIHQSAKDYLVSEAAVGKIFPTGTHSVHRGIVDSLVNSVAFSPDGSRIVSGSHDETVKIWDSKSGKEVRTLKGHGSYVSSVAFSPDGSHIVSGSDDKTVKIWDTKSGKKVRTEPMGHAVFRLRFESLSDSGLLLQTDAGSILLSVGNSADNHGGCSRVGDRSSLVIGSNDQWRRFLDYMVRSRRNMAST